jgi:hypothetical protein
MKSILEKKLTYKALGFLHQNDFLIDVAMENPSPEVQAQFKIKNVCAAIPGVLVTRLEDTLSLLGMTKREFLESAIIDALDKADVVMAECGVFEYLEFEQKAHNQIQAEYDAKEGV